MTFHFITSAEKKKIRAQLEEQFGITTLPYLLIETGKERVRGFSGSLSRDELVALGSILHIEGVGCYLARREHDLRLSFDGIHLFQQQITKGTIDLTDAEFQDWIRGVDIVKEAPQGTLLVTYKGDYFGCAKSTGTMLMNHVPKERRLKKPLINKTE